MEVETISKALNEFDEEVERLKEKIKAVRKQKQQYMDENSKTILLDKIKRYEERCDITVWNIESLVLDGETFEQWYERAGSQCCGATKKDSRGTWKEHCERHYESGGIYTDINYIKWLLEACDERLKPYKIYNKCKMK
ncbi:MAG: hypothetical protein WC365_08620 [Candidatus Babeliales bacterium]